MAGQMLLEAIVTLFHPASYCCRPKLVWAPPPSSLRVLVPSASQEKLQPPLRRAISGNATEMVLIDININVFNVLKFIAVEVLVAWALQSAWELIISRSSHARVVRGEQVTLTSLARSRTFPCALSTGRLSRFVVVSLSLLALGGSLATNYAVDSFATVLRTLKRYKSTHAPTDRSPS